MGLEWQASPFAKAHRPQRKPPFCGWEPGNFTTGLRLDNLRPGKECSSAWGFAAGQRRPMPRLLEPHTQEGSPGLDLPVGEDPGTGGLRGRRQPHPPTSSSSATLPGLPTCPQPHPSSAPGSGLRPEFQPDPGKARLHVWGTPRPRLCHRTKPSICLTNTLLRITRGGFPTWCPMSAQNVPAQGGSPAD